MRKVKVEVTHPVHDADGNAVLQPGTQFDPDDKALEGLPAGVVREVIVDEPEPEAKPVPPAKVAAGKTKTEGN